jgi:hypothetical protein
MREPLRGPAALALRFTHIPRAPAQRRRPSSALETCSAGAPGSRRAAGRDVPAAQNRPARPNYPPAPVAPRDSRHRRSRTVPAKRNEPNRRRRRDGGTPTCEAPRRFGRTRARTDDVQPARRRALQRCTRRPDYASAGHEACAPAFHIAWRTTTANPREIGGMWVDLRALARSTRFETDRSTSSRLKRSASSTSNPAVRRQ